jgi:uncharacterized protein (DUF1778 family)
MPAKKKHSDERQPQAQKPTSAKSARLAARVSADQKMILARAAALRRQPVSQFVISSAMQAAEETIREHDLIVLSARDSQIVMDALLNPEPAGPALRRVAERYHAFVSEQQADSQRGA